MTTKKAGRVLEHPPACSPVPSTMDERSNTMIPQTTVKTCPAGTPWCDNHDAEQNLCIRSTGSFVLGDTDGRRYNEGRDDMPVTVSTRKYAGREPLIEVEIPETTDLGGEDLSVQWFSGPEARTLGLALTEAADTLVMNRTCPSWCSVDHQTAGTETRTSDGAEVVIHEAEFGMVDLVQEQAKGRPLHESASVTPEVETPAHFASCTETAIGRQVLAFFSTYGPDTAVTMRRLTEDLDPYRGFCTCFRMQLAHVKADLASARKAQDSGHDKTAVIADLTARRDALKAVAK